MKGAILALLLVGASAAHADPRRAHLEKHIAFLAGGGLALTLSETVFEARLAPATCRWCATDGFDTAVRGALVWGVDHRGAANLASNVSELFLVPGIAVVATAATTWRDQGGWEGLDDLVDLGEAAVIASLVDGVAKFGAGRARPSVVFAGPDHVFDVDDNASFFSGHTNVAFALATAGGTIASRRHQRYAPVIWAGGLGLAAFTGYLRIAADKHWATDVLTGALVGSASGLLVPRLLHDHDLTLVPMPNGVALTGTF